jgi:hypothetical protein
MSHSRKHVVSGAVHDHPVPEGEQEIVRVTEMRGSNIVEVVRPSGEKILCLMPAKFKKTLWIKRGKTSYPIPSLYPSTIISSLISLHLIAQFSHISHISFSANIFLIILILLE